METMEKVHFFFNSKGGVGKSHQAAVLAQFYQHRGETVMVFDADATSATLSAYAALNVIRVPVMAGNDINPRKFDSMMDPALRKRGHVIGDFGASSFVAINAYCIRNRVPAMIQAAGKTLVINIIIVGDGSFTETCLNLKSIAEQMPPEVEIVVWLNPHFGLIENGKSFEQMDVYQRHQERISGLVRLPDWTFVDQQTFGEDVLQMTRASLTFDETQTSPDFGFMAKSRLYNLKTEIYGQLGLVF